MKVLSNVYNEERGIAKMIESVYDYVTEIHLFDGAYHPYPHDKPYSTDNTKDIATRYDKVVWHECPVAYESQEVKRSKMFEVLEEGEYGLVLDGDEHIANPEIFEQINYDFDCGWVWSISNLYPKPYMKPRIFKKYAGMHYAGRHHWLFDKTKHFMVSDQNTGQKYTSKDTPIRLYNSRQKIKHESQDKLEFLAKRNGPEQKYLYERCVYGLYEKATPHQYRAGRIKRPFQVIQESGTPVYSITVMFSRPWAVERYFNRLELMHLPQNAEYLCLIDTNDALFVNDVVKRLRKLKFATVKYYVTNNPKLKETADVVKRRARIVDNWDILMPEVEGKYIFATEDDSLPQVDAFVRLRKTLEQENADFVQGNIIGRWNNPMNPAWKIEDKDGEPVRVWTPPQKLEGIEEIQGVGWYCFLAKTDVCRKYVMSVNDDVLPFGPDLRFGHKLSQGGYRVLHDWGVHVEHFGVDFELIIGKETPRQLDIVKRGGKWVLR